MSVTSSITKAGPFVCDGVQTTFPFAFKVLDASHIRVYVGAELVSGYEATLISGGELGGQITFETPPVIGSKLVILRDVPFNQTTDIQNHTAFLPEIIETALDKLTMLCQQLKELSDRAVTLDPTGDTTTVGMLEEIRKAYSYAADARVSAESALTSCTYAQASKEAAAVSAYNAMTAAQHWEDVDASARAALANLNAIKDEIHINDVSLTFGRRIGEESSCVFGRRVSLSDIN